MGHSTAVGLAELSLERGIAYHLRGNHYPPVPLEMVKPCIDAIDAGLDEDWDRMIDMPKVGDFQILYKGSKQAPAWAIIEQHHLDPWLDNGDEEDDSDIYTVKVEDE